MTTNSYVDLVDRLAVSVTTKLIERQFAHRYFCWQNHNGKVRMVPFEQHVARIRQAKENGHRIGSAWDRRLSCLVWYELHVPARIQRRRMRRRNLLTPKARVRMVGQPLPLFHESQGFEHVPEDHKIKAAPKQCERCHRFVSGDGRGHKPDCVNPNPQSPQQDVMPDGTPLHEVG